MKQAEERFEADLVEVLAGREVDVRGRRWIRARTVIEGDDREALERAVEQWFRHRGADKVVDAARAVQRRKAT